MLKKTSFKLQLQHAQDCFIQKLFLHQPFFHCFLQSGKGLVPEPYIHAGFECRCPCMKGITFCIFQEVHSQAIGHDNALKAHLFPEHIS